MEFALIKLVACVVLIVVGAVVHVLVSSLLVPKTYSSAICLCALSLCLIRVSGAHLRTVAALPIPTHQPIGKIGSVWKNFEPKSSTVLPTDFPSSLALIAAKTIIHMSPIAKKFTISQENQSIASHQGSLENSKEAIHQPMLTASFQVDVACVDWIPSTSLIADLLSLALKPLTRAVIKISEMLRAATVMTGAKIMPITPVTLRYSSRLFILIKSLKLALRIINGEATIYIRRIHTLRISTKANAISGKKSAIATSALMINTPDVHDVVVTLASVS
ncbi:MAG: hypothetical protein WCL18_09680 [bacterium]